MADPPLRKVVGVIARGTPTSASAEAKDEGGAGDGAATSQAVSAGRPPAAEAGAAAIDRLRQLHAEAQAAAGSAADDGADRRDAGGRSVTFEVGAAGNSGAREREAGLLALLQIEADARGAKSEVELATLMANAPRRLTGARQIFVMSRVGSVWRAVAISSVPAVDRTAPLTRLIEQVVERHVAGGRADKPADFRITAYLGEGDKRASGYPMQEALWVPFAGGDSAITAGMLLTREDPWLERDIVIATRLGGAFAHAWAALGKTWPSWRRWRAGRRTKLAVGLGIAALAMMPVSLTTLAPVEVIARDPFVVAAPIEGVIDSIPVEPNARVRKGDLLVKFDNTAPRNKLEVAEREVLVAEARLKTTTQLAFSDERGRHDLAVARADLVLKRAERDFARDLLTKTEIRAPNDGLAVFADKKTLLGKPMAVGERILEIADPANVEVRIDVPASDSIILKSGARVSLLLDSSPLSTIPARIEHSDFQARPSDANVLSFRAVASLDESGAVPRLGARGSAQIYGDKVVLAYFLLRRPLTKLRQWTGL